MTAGIHLSVWFISILFWLALSRPAYANGGHVHLGGIFFLLLGGLIFFGGIGVIFYLLFRAEPEEEDESLEEEFDDA
jgi:hypothetical protein